MISKMREKCKNKKGFTLVELIVVLVILAILIALLVPALTGYIDKAKQRGVETEARNALIAAQTEIDELYKDATAGEFSTAAASTETIDKIKILAEVEGTISGVKATANGKITDLTYVNSGYTAVYAPPTGGGKSTWTVTKTTT